MSVLLSLSQVSKTLGNNQIFDNLSLGIHENEKVGLLGPNGAGKSTLLKLLAQEEPIDHGQVSLKKGAFVSFVKQEDDFDNSLSLFDLFRDRLIKMGLEPSDADIESGVSLGKAEFTDFNKKVGELSGGWRKRLAISLGLATKPQVLLLDEPTNHMDWESILWLENSLHNFSGSFLIVSHDREFLKGQCTRFIEINKVYKDGYLSLNTDYDNFLVEKQSYIEAQMHLQASMANKARRELEWLRAGVKARTTKSRSRINEAHKLFENLEQVKQRNLSIRKKVNLNIDSAGKRSKKFLEFKDLTIAYDENVLVENLNLTLGPKTCLGILGLNGSGKTSLLKTINKSNTSYRGTVEIEEDFKILYFDQNRVDLPLDKNPLQFLGDDSDHVVFQERSIHVASYASHFLFTSEKMNLPINKLSGGERARLQIAKLLLQPADVLLLDEPTNDLDIETIEILEAALQDFPGLILLVSHDRYFLRSICTSYLAIESEAQWNIYADLEQWIKHYLKAKKKPAAPKAKEHPEPTKKGTKNLKLTYKEKRQLETIEEDVMNAEAKLEEAQALLENEEVTSNHEKLEEAMKSIEERKKVVEELYEIWGKIEEKLQG